MAADVTGKDIVDFISEGVNTYVKDHVRNQIVDEMVEDFRARITEEVEGKLSEMVFKSQSQFNGPEMRRELVLLIEWSKGQAEYKRKYTVQNELVST